MAGKLNVNTAQYVFYASSSSALPAHYGVSGTAISENEQAWEIVPLEINVEPRGNSMLQPTRVSIERISGAKR